MQVKNAFLPQYLGQYSGPWHLAQAIAGSQYATTDIDAADIVYVYDYCYYTWWLGFVHSNGRVQRDDATPGDHLLKGYQVRSLLARHLIAQRIYKYLHQQQAIRPIQLHIASVQQRRLA